LIRHPENVFMKTNGTRFLIFVIFLYLFVVILSFTTHAQPEYDFTTKTHIGGTDRQVGGLYRFSNVKPGIDAIVTITALTGGVTLDDIDGNSGFKEALQPVIRVPAASSGYAELTIAFVTTATFTPQTMLEVPLTCIDVDGRLFGGLACTEFDQVRRTPGMYADFNMTGGELLITFDPTWVTGTNIGIIDYPGVDTMAKQAMFSTVSSNVSSMTVRVGATNLSAGSQQRLRSIYFKRFTYANSFLSKSSLLDFRGMERNKKVQLEWSLISDHAVRTVIIEKNAANSGFKSIGEVWVDANKAQGAFRFSDNESISGNTLYRLKLVAANGSVSYSTILSFRTADATEGSFKIYPSSIQSNATMNISAAQAGNAVFEIVDYAGRIVRRKSVNVQEGTNTIQLNDMSGVHSGNYIAVLRIDKNTYSQKIVKQ
jgi:hypothetical protein